MIAALIVLLLVGYAAWSFICLELNYRRASSMNIPLVREFVDPHNVLFITLEQPIFRLLNSLPFDLPHSARYYRRGWHFKDKADSYLQFGPIWALVTSCDVYVHIADAEAINQVFSRKHDFQRPIKNYKLLEVYGPCISTADWKNWPRHRKILAAPFNENAMSFIWDESLRQAKGMVDVWVQGISSVAKDTRGLSLNVLAATGFRKSYPFRGSDQSVAVDEDSYRYALQTVLDNIILLMLVPPRFLLWPCLPKSWTRIGNAAASFKRHMTNMLNEEVKLQVQGQKGTGGLMTSFVRALDQHDKAASAANVKLERSTPKGLTVDEIFGNLFVINFAGHDTTANTLAFAMLLLAANPDVQDWVAEEVRDVMEATGPTNWDYGTSYSRLPRCQAVMHETLRLFPPIMALPKMTMEQPQKLQIGNRSITIPPNVSVTLGVLAVHTHPKIWSDPLTWKPPRWIIPGPSKEEFISPKQGTFFPWSDGPQNCPGAKFSQVEFVAVIACLLLSHRLRPVKEPGESFEQARQRILQTTEGCEAEMLLRMRDADRVRLTCVKI